MTLLSGVDQTALIALGFLAAVLTATAVLFGWLIVKLMSKPRSG